jgi:[NiFe] hydrogenase assembly HybE family chaperone
MNEAVASGGCQVANEGAPDPAPALQRAFETIHRTRMRDMPMCNHALQVEAVDFRRWNGLWLGALVTPWFINLMLLQDAPQVWTRRRVGEKAVFAFPAGRFEFIAGREPLIDGVDGEYLSCSLFSPVFEFADHETARMAAQMSLAGLFDEANFELPDLRVAAQPPQTISAAAQQAAEEAERAQAVAAEGDGGRLGAAGVSKRDFLRGRWRGEST